jgi:hypothetical protein
MANVIIPPEHQSAPKEPVRLVTSTSFNTSAPVKNATDFDTEMDLPQYNDPNVLELERRGYHKASEASIEEALRQHEINAQKVKGYQWQGQGRWQGRENEEMRLVGIMHPHSFIEKLRRAGVAASVDEPTPGNPRIERLWLNPFSRAGRVGVNAWVPDEEAGKLTPQTVTTLQYPYGPEYSIMRFDAYNLPTNEKYRGWRTALLTLIMTNVITEEEALRAFGEPLGLAGAFYREQLFYHRAIRAGIRPQ